MVSPNGVKGSKERRDLPKGNGLRRGRVRGDYDKNCTRQPAITNSTPPVEDNYRASREATRACGARRCGSPESGSSLNLCRAADERPFFYAASRCSLFNLLTQIDCLILFSGDF